ncbi:hypothetical protein [Sessilibacter corallicola]|uniref:hypothetical protein n=1 Tax=Sessilibacter corallicola TaxID=2904075 RepID=UPI001E3DC16C|nr:hypothetical protein [Sessilibacter corallicola]MCE2028614.1 hypothetical protein [Sessilibacter corallicola]
MINNFIKSILLMKRITTLCVLSSLLVAQSVHAQTSADSNDASAVTPNAEQQAETENDDSAKTDNDPGFVPTEEISEDLSVSFPTDI